MVRPKTKERRGQRTYHGKHKNARGGGSRGGGEIQASASTISCVL